MRTVSVRLSDLERAVVPIGFVGENQHTQVRIDCLKLYEEYPHAAASLTVKPPKGDSYPAVVVRDGNTVVWEITDSDLIYDGNGEIQLSFTVDEVVAKSYVGRIKISRSITPTGEVPEPLDDFLTRAGAALTAIPETIAVALQEAKDSGEFDGYSPTVVVTEIIGGHQVTVTDVNGDHVFLVMDGVDGEDGHSPVVTASKSGKVTTVSVDGEPIAEIDDGADGQNGRDGHSPVVTASKSGKVTTVSVDGTAIATINDGNDGQDGFSPTASVSKNGSVATISITDKNGTTTAQVSDGQDGDPGATPVISIGTVSTLSPGSDATASMDTTDPAHPVLSLGIPEGEPGEVTEAELFDATHGRWNEDNEPYLFRASGGDASVYEWERDTLIGGTVAWNQLAKNFIERSETLGVTINVDNTAGTIHAYGTPSATNNLYFINNFPILVNHVYYFRGAVDNNNGNYLQINVSNGMGTQNDTGSGSVLKPISGTGLTLQMCFGFVSGQAVDVTWHPQIFDLTQMFGSTIADYIYNLETGTPGAGIAWLKKHGFMTKPYYAYDDGTLMSGKALSHVTVGFNLFDENTYFLANGFTKNADGSYSIDALHSLNEKTIWKNELSYEEQICVSYKYKYQNGTGSAGLRVRFIYTDGTAQFDYPTVTTTLTDRTVVSQNGKTVQEIKWDYGTSSNGTTFVDFCINLSSSRNGQYEPYTSNTYALGSDELRGLFMLDSNNKLYCNGDTKTSDGTVTRKYGAKEIKAADIALAYNTYSDIVYARVEKPNDSADKGKATTKAINTKFVANSATSNWNSTSKIGFLFGGADYAHYWFGFAIGTTLEQMKTALAGTYLVYELATPTTESADPFTNPQAVSPYGTEEYTDSRAVPIPVGHETKYLMNPYQYVEELTKPTEDDMVANNNITSGSYFVIGNRLFKASSAIASGSAIIPGSNCVETNLAEALNTLQ